MTGSHTTNPKRIASGTGDATSSAPAIEPQSIEPTSLVQVDAAPDGQRTPTATAAVPEAPVPAASAPVPKPFGWRFTAPLLLGSTLNPINSATLATGLVSIGVDMHLGPGPAATLISVLYLCSAIMQPTMGKISTLLGARRTFLTGIVILFVGGAVGAFAPSFGFLLLSRALIGVGTSAAYPTAMALVRRRADATGSGVPSRVLGNFSIAAQVSAVIGLPLGGILVGLWGWRALFAINLPVAIITYLFTMLGVPKDAPRERRGGRGILTALDLPGIGLFAATIVSLLVFLGDLKAPIWWLLAVFAVLLVALVLWERRAKSPMIDVRMLARNSPLQRTYLRQTLAALGMYTMMYGAPQFLEDGMHVDAATAGLIMLPMSAASIVLARVVSNRGWVRWPLVTGGIALIGAGAVGLFLTSESSWLIAVGMSLLVGVANGFTGFANQASLYTQTRADEIAVASGLYRTFAYIGAIFSSSLIGLAFGAKATDSGFHTMAWVVGALGVALILMTVFDRRIPKVAGEAR
ncbi:MFS transporter [Planctomonas sp. JC2975]|uniref:MFS transporter n=1 Tax=Planctomonas sp. JC2975 TaxID=2729626 RepID=UPI001473D527|nr:MFS transporter [Planctomonas sp. JC2975]NNC12730.1 MFS transporter [Planctomonas sp. JC2975]